MLCTAIIQLMPIWHTFAMTKSCSASPLSRNSAGGRHGHLLKLSKNSRIRHLALTFCVSQSVAKNGKAYGRQTFSGSLTMLWVRMFISIIFLHWDKTSQTPMYRFYVPRVVAWIMKNSDNHSATSHDTLWYQKLNRRFIILVTTLIIWGHQIILINN